MPIFDHLGNGNPNEIAPALFIGMGGSGRAILREIKSRLRDIYHGELPGVYQCLYIDTAPLTNHLGQEFLDRDEYVHLGAFNPAEVVAHGALHPYIMAWLPDQAPGISSALHGAGQRRYLGRMAFFLGFPAVYEALSHKLADMKAIAATEALRLEGYQVNDAIAQVFVFGSLAGGTGSGIFLDLAYLIRELAPEVFLHGVLCLSDVFYPVLRNYNSRRRAEANCFAALLELDYFVHNRLFEADYGPRQVTIKTAPFTTTYLVSLQNSGGKRLKHTDDIFRMIAYWTVTQVAAGLGNQQLEEMANITATAQDMPPYLGYQRAYSAFVAAALLFPAEDIADYGGLRFGQTLIETGYLDQNGRTPNEVALIPGLESENIRRALQPNHGELSSRRTQTQVIQRATKATVVFRALDRQTADQAEKLRGLSRLVQERQPELVSTTIEAVEVAVWEETKYAGLRAGIIFIRGLFERVAEVIRALEAEHEVTEGHRQDIEDRLQQARREIEMLRRYTWLPWRRSRLRETGLHASRLLTERDETIFSLLLLRTLIDIYRQLQDGVDQLRPEFRNLRQLEAALQVRCREFDELAHQFDWMAQELLAGRVTNPKVFDLATPVVEGDYIRRFYEYQREQAQNLTHMFNEFNANFADLNEFLKLPISRLREQLLAFTRRPFAERVANIRLLDLFKSDLVLTAQSHIRLDTLLARADVFLRYQPNQGFGQHDLAYTAHLGVDHWDPDEATDLIEPALEKHRAFSITYTGDPHWLHVARTAHGFPLILLADLAVYQRSYEELIRSGASPLHIDKRWPLESQNGHWPWANDVKPETLLNEDETVR